MKVSARSFSIAAVNEKVLLEIATLAALPQHVMIDDEIGARDVDTRGGSHPTGRIPRSAEAPSLSSVAT